MVTALCLVPPQNRGNSPLLLAMSTDTKDCQLKALGQMATATARASLKYIASRGRRGQELTGETGRLQESGDMAQGCCMEMPHTLAVQHRNIALACGVQSHVPESRFGSALRSRDATPWWGGAVWSRGKQQHRAWGIASRYGIALYCCGVEPRDGVQIYSFGTGLRISVVV